MFCLRHFDEVTDSAAKEEWHQWFHEGPVCFPKHVGNYILSKSLELLVTLLVPSFFMTQNRRKEKLLGHFMEGWLCYVDWQCSLPNKPVTIRMVIGILFHTMGLC